MVFWWRICKLVFRRRTSAAPELVVTEQGEVVVDTSTFAFRTDGISGVRTLPAGKRQSGQCARRSHQAALSCRSIVDGQTDHLDAFHLARRDE